MHSVLPARLDPAVDGFEAAWAAGPPPRVADYLPPPGDPDRPALLAELIRVDLERRAAGNDFPDPHALYADLLPEQTAEAVAGLERYAAAVRDRHRPGAPADPLPVVEGYEVHEELGRGGMGVVYRATHRALNREVALKVLPAGTPEGAARRFEREAEAAAAVRHPHAVVVYEFGRAGGRPYLAMELCPGGTLADRLKAGRLDPRAAAGLVAKVARGVAAAHAEGIVHRDLKPANVLFDASGEPKVADFGLAKLSRSDVTETGAVMGTLPYMAPEQVAGGAKFITPAADVWALGAILYECLTGARPFGGGDTWELIDRIGHADPPGVRRGCPGCPRDLEAVVLKCLAKPAHHRYPTASELAADLDRFLAGEAVTARRPSAVGRAARWARRRPAAAVAVVLSTALVVVLAGGMYAFDRAQRTEADRRTFLNDLDDLTGDPERFAEMRARLDELRPRLPEAESVRDLLKLMDKYSAGIAREIERPGQTEVELVRLEGGVAALEADAPERASELRKRLTGRLKAVRSEQVRDAIAAGDNPVLDQLALWHVTPEVLVRYKRQADLLAREYVTPKARHRAALGLAAAHHANGEPSRAAELLEDLLRIGPDLDDGETLVEVVRQYVWACRERGAPRLPEIRGMVESQIAGAGDRDPHGLLTLELARLDGAAGDYKAAVIKAEAVYARCREQVADARTGRAIASAGLAFGVFLQADGRAKEAQEVCRDAYNRVLQSRTIAVDYHETILVACLSGEAGSLMLRQMKGGAVGGNRAAMPSFFKSLGSVAGLPLEGFLSNVMKHAAGSERGKKFITEHVCRKLPFGRAIWQSISVGAAEGLRRCIQGVWSDPRPLAPEVEEAVWQLSMALGEQVRANAAEELPKLLFVCITGTPAEADWATLQGLITDADDRATLAYALGCLRRQWMLRNHEAAKFLLSRAAEEPAAKSKVRKAAEAALAEMKVKPGGAKK